MEVIVVGCWVYCVVTYFVYAELVVCSDTHMVLCVLLFECHCDGG